MKPWSWHSSHFTDHRPPSKGMHVSTKRAATCGLMALPNALSLPTSPWTRGASGKAPARSIPPECPSATVKIRGSTGLCFPSRQAIHSSSRQGSDGRLGSAIARPSCRRRAPPASGDSACGNPVRPVSPSPKEAISSRCADCLVSSRLPAASPKSPCSPRPLLSASATQNNRCRMFGAPRPAEHRSATATA
jgi:hypothetical protein